MLPTLNKTKLVSTTRLPADHLISGALVGAMGGLVGAYMGKKPANTAEVINSVTKSAISGGVMHAAAVGASNALVARQYINAGLYIAGGVASVIVINKIFSKDK